MRLRRLHMKRWVVQHGQYGFWFGAKFGHKPGMWLIDPLGKNLEGAPISKSTRVEWLRWLKGESVQNQKFEHPKVEGDQISRYLDSITLERHNSLPSCRRKRHAPQ